MVDLLVSRKSLSIRMDRAFAANLPALSQASEFVRQVALRECHALAADQGEACLIGLVHVIATVDRHAENAELLARIRILTPKIFSHVRSPEVDMQNEHEARHLGRPTRINFRLHFKADGKSAEQLTQDVYDHALRECERAQKALGSACEIESVKFSSRDGWVDAQINLVMPHAVGFGGGHNQH